MGAVRGSFGGATRGGRYMAALDGPTTQLYAVPEDKPSPAPREQGSQSCWEPEVPEACAGTNAAGLAAVKFGLRNGSDWTAGGKTSGTGARTEQVGRATGICSC